MSVDGDDSEWVAGIRERLNQHEESHIQQIANIIETGEYLKKAKNAIGHGLWETRLAEAGTDKDVARRYMAIAKNANGGGFLANPATWPHLPPSYKALTELLPLTEQDFWRAVERGDLDRDTTVKKAHAVAKFMRPAAVTATAPPAPRSYKAPPPITWTGSGDDLANFLYHCEDAGELYCGPAQVVLPLLQERAAAEKRDRDAHVLVTDPPWGVNLVARTCRDNRGSGKHHVEPASVTYDDDPDEIAAMIREVIPLALSCVDRALIFPGTRMLWNYPVADAVGAVSMPNGPSRSRWGWQTSMPILFYGADPYMSDGLGARANGFEAKGGKQETFDHPCPKPLKWMEWAVERVSRPHETVIDCFAGVGSTLVAARASGRKFLGVELEPHYCDIAIGRLAGAMEQAV